MTVGIIFSSDTLDYKNECLVMMASPIPAATNTLKAYSHFNISHMLRGYCAQILSLICCVKHNSFYLYRNSHTFDSYFQITLLQNPEISFSVLCQIFILFLFFQIKIFLCTDQGFISYFYFFPTSRVFICTPPKQIQLRFLLRPSWV